MSSVGTVVSALVLAWAVEAPSPEQRRNRLLTVRRFALAMHAENPRHQVPAADALGHAVAKRRSPYIYGGRRRLFWNLVSRMTSPIRCHVGQHTCEAYAQSFQLLLCFAAGRLKIMSGRAQHGQKLVGRAEAARLQHTARPSRRRLLRETAVPEP
jgi:hypothetical protein